MTPTAGEKTAPSPKQFALTSAGLLLFLGIVWLTGAVMRSHTQSHWPEISAQDDKRSTQAFQEQFRRFENGITLALDSVHSIPGLQFCFLSDDDSVQESLFFTRILPAITSTAAIEVYDRDNHLIGWSGARGPGIHLSQLLDRPHTFVIEDQIYSYLVISRPLRMGEQLVGHLVGKRAIHVNSPINNRFINRSVVEEVFPGRAEFDFSEHAVAAPDSHQVAVELKGADGGKLGIAYLHKETLDERLRSIESTVDVVVRTALFVFLIIASASFLRMIGRKDRPVLWSVSWIGFVWVLRYVFLWTALPASLGGEVLFGPSEYASPFGDGIASSLGDFFVSAAAVAVSAGLLIAGLAAWKQSREMHRARSVAGKVLYYVLTLVFVVVCAVLLRAFASIVQSAVFDSTLQYNETTSFLPSFDLAVSLLSIYCFAGSLLALAVAAFAIALELIAAAGPPERSWLRTGILVLMIPAVGIPFGLLQDQPLVGPWTRTIFLIVSAVCAFLLLRRFRLTGRFPVLFGSGVLALISIILVPPILDRHVHELDRLHVEMLSRETARPADAWSVLVVRQALTELSGADAVGEMLAADTEDIAGLAFRRWAKSVLGREGTVCSVTYVNRAGDVLSDFHIGVPPHAGGAHHVVVPVTSPTVHTEERLANGRLSRWHVGYQTLVTTAGDTIGGVLVEVAGGRQVAIEAEAPEFLRTSYRNQNTSGRQIVFSEYYQGRLSYTTDDRFPAGRALPQDLTGRNSGDGSWLRETIDGRPFISYYVREDHGQGESDWVGLSVPSAGFQEHFFFYSRLIIFYLLTLFAIVVPPVAIHYIRRNPYTPSFRVKVLVALCVVGLLPVVVLAVYNRSATLRQSDDYVRRRLEDETAVVLAEIQRTAGGMTPASLNAITDERCAQIASIVKTDFSLYLLRSVQASSKPELFLAGVLDSRVSAGAYANIVVQRKRFFVERQQIGLLPYVVGYRPVIAEDGSTIGIVSVPTLYRQIEVDEELAQRNSILYGVYAMVVLLSVLLGTIFAGQISAPIRRLMAAAGQVGVGKLDLPPPSNRTDELGQLEQAFHRMAGDLRRTQEAMMRAEREMAWREMAKQVAHEIKNPLTPMKLSVQHLRQAYADGVADFRELFEKVSSTILAQIDTLTRIATEFSHYGRMPERNVVLCDIHELLHEVVTLHTQPRITFTERYTAERHELPADPEELRRCFINIVRNALQAIAAEGSITVSTSTFANHLLVEIDDTGTGIAPNDLQRIFEPNFSTKTDGMGLGLSIVKQIVNDMHGEVAIESAVGKGTRVSLRFPLGRETGVIASS